MTTARPLLASSVIVDRDPATGQPRLTVYGPAGRRPVAAYRVTVGLLDDLADQIAGLDDDQDGTADSDDLAHDLAGEW